MKTGDFVIISNPDMQYEAMSGYRRFPKGTVAIVGDVDRDDSIEVIANNTFWYYSKNELTPYTPFDEEIKKLKGELEKKKNKYSKQENSYQKGVYNGYKEGLKEVERLLATLKNYEGIIRSYEKKLNKMI